MSPGCVFAMGKLAQVTRDELGHLEHRNLALAAKERAELIVGHDIALVLRVLEVVRLNVLPQFLNDLPSRHRPRARHCLKFGRELHWL